MSTNHSSPETDTLLARLERCAKYDFDTIEMIECKWELWDEILEALSIPAQCVWPTGTGNTPQDVQLASLVTRSECSCGADDGDPFDHHDISCPAAHTSHNSQQGE